VPFVTSYRAGSSGALCCRSFRRRRPGRNSPQFAAGLRYDAGLRVLALWASAKQRRHAVRAARATEAPDWVRVSVTYPRGLVFLKVPYCIVRAAR
jgi:hypothetical protein